MINEETIQNEFWNLFDIMQNSLNWRMSLETFEINNELLSDDLQNNKGLEHFTNELIKSKKGLSFLMIGYNAKSNKNNREEKMFCAMKLGYAIHQLNIEDITSYNGNIVYDELFHQYQVENHFELLADFFSDEYMSEKLYLNNMHQESFIYFAAVMGFIIRAQLVKLKMNIQNDIEQPELKKLNPGLKVKCVNKMLQWLPNIIIIENEKYD